MEKLTQVGYCTLLEDFNFMLLLLHYISEGITVRFTPLKLLLVDTLQIILYTN